MISIILMLTTHFMTLYRICKVLRKGYGTLCEVYGNDMRKPLLAAISDPDKDWDDHLMVYMDKIFKYQKTYQKTIPRA